MKNNLRIGPIRIRPKYKRLSSLPPCKVIDEIQEDIAENREIEGSTLGNNATIKIAKQNRRFWSPEFDINIVKRGKGSLIKAVVGPNPKVWAVFIFFYSLAIILFFLGMLMEIYQWLFDMETSVSWYIPVSLLTAFLVIVFSKIGQYKGKKQMLLLWNILERSVDEGERKEKSIDG